jgi:hypothetical protein
MGFKRSPVRIRPPRPLSTPELAKHFGVQSARQLALAGRFPSILATWIPFAGLACTFTRRFNLAGSAIVDARSDSFELPATDGTLLFVNAPKGSEPTPNLAWVPVFHLARHAALVRIWQLFRNKSSDYDSRGSIRKIRRTSLYLHNKTERFLRVALPLATAELRSTAAAHCGIRHCPHRETPHLPPV